MAICLWGGVTWWLSGKMQEMHVPSLGQEDPLEKEMATTPVFLPRKSHGQRSLVVSQKSQIQLSD